MIIIEGSDGVGKTATIAELKKQGIDCKDREKNIFSKYMEFNIPMNKRADIYERYLVSHEDTVIFLINNDANELMRRIHQRKILDAYDLKAPEYNRLYLDTYKYMLRNHMLHDKLFLVCCTKKNIEEQANLVKELIKWR